MAHHDELPVPMHSLYSAPLYVNGKWHGVPTAAVPPHVPFPGPGTVGAVNVGPTDQEMDQWGHVYVQRTLAILGDWERRGISVHAVFFFDGKPVQSRSDFAS